MQKADPLIRTKLHLPFIRSSLVSRPRLQEQIAHGLCGPLTLITAPAGFGKTTLVAASIANCGMPVVWLSLDKNDNQAGRFMQYLVAALQEADPTIGNEAAQLLAAAQPAPLETILTSLINDLDIARKEIALVLDDYQLISSQAVHEAVAFLLEHCPKTLHLVIATRSDPPLRLARLRARGQTVELRAADLRFTELEAAQFLNDVMGLNLDTGSVAALEERTEGWVAGLQMASIAVQARLATQVRLASQACLAPQSYLSVHDHKDIFGFIKGFSGTNRYILDYLLEEVLSSQPPEMEWFLLCTSILERLTAPLCDAILANDAQATPEGQDRFTRSESLLPPQSASNLEYLERANLFLVPLDDERLWYRYHQLFADLLRARLDQYYPGLSPRLHARAAAWLEREGMMVEAVNHTLAAGEYDRAARLVEENTTRLFAQGELNALMGWIEALPAELRQMRPWLCIHQAYALAFAGQLAEVPPLLAQAATVLGPAASRSAANKAGDADVTCIPPATTSLSPAECRALAGAIAALQSMAAVMTGHEAEAIAPAQQARELLPADDFWNRASAAWSLGYALRSQGNLPEAGAAFEEMIQSARASGHIWSLVTGLCDMAAVLRAQGKMPQSRALLEEALAEASQQGARNLGFIARPEAHLAGALCEQNELGAAHRLLSDAIAHARFWPNPNHLALAYSLLALVLLAEGDLHGAWSSIGEADRIRRSAALTGLSERLVGADLVRVWLAFQTSGVKLSAGDPLAGQASALVAAWRSELAGSMESGALLIDEASETAALTLARVALAAGRSEEALSFLKPLTHSTRTTGHAHVAIPSLILTAIAWQSKPAGQPLPALTALEEALRLAEPGGYMRVFLDEGRPMQQLLTRWLAYASTGALRDYAILLLSHFAAEAHVVNAVQKKVSPDGDLLASSGQVLVEPLSQRELEVLHFLALGRTNQEIARQLIVSPGTVKAHTASIYRKLGVANRTEAVAHARQLRILS